MPVSSQKGTLSRHEASLGLGQDRSTDGSVQRHRLTASNPASAQPSISWIHSWTDNRTDQSGLVSVLAPALQACVFVPTFKCKGESDASKGFCYLCRRCHAGRDRNRRSQSVGRERRFADLQCRWWRWVCVWLFQGPELPVHPYRWQ